MSPLRRRMIDDMQIRNLTPNTQRVYVAQVVRFACHFRKSPELLGPAEVPTYLIHLTQERVDPTVVSLVAKWDRWESCANWFWLSGHGSRVMFDVTNSNGVGAHHDQG